MGRAEREGDFLTEKEKSKSRKITTREQKRVRKEERISAIGAFKPRRPAAKELKMLKCFPGPGGVTSRPNLPVFIKAFLYIHFQQPAATCCYLLTPNSRGH